MPRVGEPIPPPPWFKEHIADGLLPKVWHDEYPQHRCRCGHVKETHDPDGCAAKKCPCTAYDENPKFLLPEWGSKPQTEIVIKPLEPGKG
jgi:hypothetical protein